MLKKIKGENSLNFSDENEQLIAWKSTKGKIREWESTAFITLSPYNTIIVIHV